MLLSPVRSLTGRVRGRMRDGLSRPAVDALTTVFNKALCWLSEPPGVIVSKLVDDVIVF